MRSLFATGEARVTAVLVALGTAASGWLIRALSVPVVDDAAISIGYGWSAWTGAGYRLTPESAVVEGFSNPTWTAIVGLTPLLSTHPVRATATIGIVLAMASLPIWASWGALARGRALRIEDAVVPLLAGGSTSFAYWAAAGLEGALLSFLLALSGAVLLHDLRQQRGSLAGLLLGLVCITRPEAPMYAIGAAILVIGVRIGERRAPGPQELRAIGWGALIVGGWLAIRIAVFAAWLPNTYYAKFGIGEPSPGYLEGFARAFPTATAAAVAGLVAIPFARPQARRAPILAALMIAITTFFAVRAGGDWMREWRFFAPIVPAGAASFAGALSVIRDRIGEPRDRHRRARAAIGALLCTALALVVSRDAWHDSLRRIEENLRGPTLGAGVVMTTAHELHGLLHDELGLVRPRVALPDVGGNGIVLRHAEIVDVGALCDYAIARTFHLHPEATEDYLVSEGLPTLIDVHGPSGALIRMRDLMRHYERLRYDPRRPQSTGIYVLRELGRDVDPRCPGGLGAVRALDTSTLAHRIDAAIDADHPDEAISLYRCAREHREDLPDDAWHVAARDRALRASERAEDGGAIERALRFSSLATILSHQDAWLRRRTEHLRERFLPAEGARARRWL